MADPAANTQAGTSPGASMTQTENGVKSAPNADLRGTNPAKKIGLGLFLLLCVVGLALLIAFFGAVRHWLALHTGTLNGGSGPVLQLLVGFWFRPR
jgi:hypothetical protein